MTATLFTLDLATRKWALNDVLPDEEAARNKARRLWRQGVAGVRITVEQVVLEHTR